MNREDVLKSAQDNGNKGKEYERHSLLRGDNLAANIGMLVCIAMIMSEFIVTKQFDFGLCGVLFTVVGIQSINEGIKLKKWWLVVTGIFEAILATLMIFVYIGALFVA
ncbi:MAG: DUF6442 family protein [Mobilitalea sp.]